MPNMNLSSKAFVARLDFARAQLEERRNILLSLCVGVVILILLFPYNFSNPFDAEENAAIQREGALQFAGKGMLLSAAPPNAMYQHLVEGQGLSLEVWLETDSIKQEGPARIISYSLDPWHQNFMLGQEGDALVVRLKTSQLNNDGKDWEVKVANFFQSIRLLHVVVSFDYRFVRVFSDGKLITSQRLRDSNFQTWDPTHLFVMGNEATGARSWQGRIRYTAIYDRPLSSSEVARRFTAGAANSAHSGVSDPLISFDFALAIRGGTGQLGDSISLERPERITTESRKFFSHFRGADGQWRLVGTPELLDMLVNVILFVPFGAIAFAWTTKMLRSASVALVVTLLMGAGLSGLMEAMQLFLAERDSSIFDVAANSTGTVIGAILGLLVLGPFRHERMRGAR